MERDEIEKIVEENIASTIVSFIIGVVIVMLLIAYGKYILIGLGLIIALPIILVTNPEYITNGINHLIMQIPNYVSIPIFGFVLIFIVRDILKSHIEVCKLYKDRKNKPVEITDKDNLLSWAFIIVMLGAILSFIYVVSNL